MTEHMVSYRRDHKIHCTTIEEYRKWLNESHEEYLRNQPQKDYQMSLIELDHQFSLDLLKW